MTSFNLADLFESVVDTVPERIALVAGDSRLSYRALDQRANRLANHLQQQGIGAEDKVGIYAFNRAEWVEAMWACFKIRAIPVNINFRYVEEELAYIFDNADVVAVIYERNFSPLLANINADLPQVTDFCRSKIAGYKIPRELVIVDTIPRTPVAKPDYRKIKAMALKALGIDK